jgi:glycogen debranching enzyme
MTAAVGSVRVRPDLLHIASGWSLLVTDTRGRIRGDGVEGCYVDNTRVLSRERLTVDGVEPEAFSTGAVGAHALLSYAELRDGEQRVGQGAYLMTERFLGEGMRTRWTVLSTDDDDLRLAVRLGLEADFLDADDTEQGRQAPAVLSRWDGHELVLATSDPLPYRVCFVVDVPGEVCERDGELRFALSVPARGEASFSVLVEPVLGGRRRHAPPAAYQEPGDVAARARLALSGEATRLRSSHVDVAMAWHTAVQDLVALPLGEPDGPSAPMAGLPFYQQVFGRDTLTASWQALLATPTLLRDSLTLNAAWAGRRVDDWYDEEPGKLLHQARRGPTSLLGEDPFLAYYGDFATNPDFLVFLGQYLAWTGDVETVRKLLPVAREALSWLDRNGSRDGFLVYDTRSEKGVKNQGWKDSDTAVVDEHGGVVENPIASSELQAYWYAGLRHAALAFARCGDRAFAADLVRQAAGLRRRFQQAFWLPDVERYAMALGPDGKPVRSANSNDGHLLASGIVPRRLAPTVARFLLQPDMFSGWGVRTLSAEHPAYNPFSYHRGSVWPVESGTIALGLARYGCWEEVHRVAEGLFAAASLFEQHRLPEVLSGLPRDDAHPHPGTYPRSCSPQAWSASAVVVVVQALLGLRPAAPLRALLVDPHLPDWLPDLSLEGVQTGGRTCDLHVRRRRGRTTIRATGGVRLLRVPLRRPLRAGRP